MGWGCEKATGLASSLGMAGQLNFLFINARQKKKNKQTNVLTSRHQCICDVAMGLYQHRRHLSDRQPCLPFDRISYAHSHIASFQLSSPMSRSMSSTCRVSRTSSLSHLCEGHPTYVSLLKHFPRSAINPKEKSQHRLYLNYATSSF